MFLFSNSRCFVNLGSLVIKTFKQICERIEKATICLNENVRLRPLNTRKKKRKRTLDTNNPVRRNVNRIEHFGHV